MRMRRDKPDTRVHDALHRIGPLPVLGGTVSRIRTLADDPHATTGDLVTVVESDEAFSANLLRYANSAANARPIRAPAHRPARPAPAGPARAGGRDLPLPRALSRRCAPLARAAARARGQRRRLL